MKVLVTGADGLLGRSLCARLVQQGIKVFGLTHAPPRNPLSGFDCLTLDFVSDWEANQLPSQVDTIIHLAQSAKFRDFPDSALDVFKVNIESTARLLDYAKRVGAKQFIHTSSGGVYGNGSQAFKENASIIPPGQLGYYLGSKTCGEILVQSYASVFKVVVLRPFFIYGSEQNRSMLMPRLMDNVAAGKPIILQGERGIRINPIHVEDASAAVAAAFHIKESATFNIAGPDVLSIREICKGMGKYLAKEPIFERQVGQANDLIADISMMRDILHDPQKRLLESFDDLQS